MMRLFVPLALVATLSGCAVVPYEGPYAAYPVQSAYDYPYANSTAYYRPVYVYPPVFLSFGLQYWSGHGGHHHRHGHSGFRHHGHGGWHGGHGRGHGRWRH